MSGPGLDLLHQLADLVLDSWLDQPTLRIYNAQQLAARVADEGANLVVVEGDTCGAELYEQPIIAVASCRGDPTNVDVPAATAAGVRSKRWLISSSEQPSQCRKIRACR